MNKFSPAGREDIPALAELWKDVFGDSESYISMFFDFCFRPEYGFLCRRQDAPGAECMLFALPLEADICGKKAAGRYIYAVATARDKRGQNLAGELLKFAQSRLASEGTDFFVLVPAEPSLFGYYEKRGYKRFFARSTHEVYIPKNPGVRRTVREADANDEDTANLLWKIRADALAGEAFFAAQTPEIFRYVLREHAFKGGRVFVADKDEGYLLVLPGPDGITVSEAVTCGPESAGVYSPERAAELLAEFFPGARVKVYTAGRGDLSPAEAQDYAMIYFPDRPDCLKSFDVCGIMDKQEDKRRYFSLALD